MVTAGEIQTTSGTVASSKQTTLEQSFATVIPYETTSRRHREVTNAITYYLAKDMASIKGIRQLFGKFAYRRKPYSDTSR